MMERLSVLRRHEGVVRSRLRPWPERLTGLNRIFLDFRDNVEDVSDADRAPLLQLAAFADHVMDGKQPEEAASLAVSQPPLPNRRQSMNRSPLTS